MNIIYLTSSGLVALFGLSAAFSLMGKDLKETLLSSDNDGWQPLILGFVLLSLGFLIPDFTGAYLLKGMGLLFAIFGGLILVDNKITNALLNPILGFVYAVVTILWFGLGALSVPGGLIYNVHALFSLVPFVALATISTTVAVLSFTSVDFKNRLVQDNGGVFLVGVGLVVLALSPFAVLNPALIIVTAGLGALMITLGGLIVADDENVKWLLTKTKTFVYAVLAVVALAVSRWLY